MIPRGETEVVQEAKPRLSPFLRQWLRNVGWVLVFLASFSLWVAPALVVEYLYGDGWFMLVLVVEAALTVAAGVAWVES